MKINFSVADRVTGAWVDFSHDLSAEVIAQFSGQRELMGYLQKQLSDDRFDGRAMVWEPAR